MKTNRLCSLFLISLTIILISTTTASQTTQADDRPNFKITKLAPNLFRVVGLKMNGSSYHAGYGDAFEEAIKIISSKNRILSINPINYVFQTGSITEEIYIVIDDKK